MITTKRGFLGSGMSYADLVDSVEFSPNEPGIPFDDSSCCGLLAGCRQSLISGQLSSDLSVTNLVSFGQPAGRRAVTNSLSIKFLPNELGIPFDRSLLPDVVEIMEKGGDLVHVDFNILQVIDAMPPACLSCVWRDGIWCDRFCSLAKSECF